MIRRSPEAGGSPAAEPVDLARAPPFTIGRLAVVPAARIVETGTWSQRLEPRVMQVLVVLAAAAPAVVGRAELNARVWGGRVVGEDAINRAVQTLRRIAAEAPAPVPFRIDTVPRVGYRLTVEDSTAAGAADPAVGVTPAPVADDDAADARAPRRRWARSWPWAAAGMAVLAAVPLWRGAPPHPPVPAPWRITGSATLDDLPPGARDVALSPDGRRLAYRGRDSLGHERIFVRGAGDGGSGSLASPPGIEARRPVWAPDSAALAFLAYDPGRPCRLYVRRPGRAAAAVGSCETTRDPRLAWSADGRALMFGDEPGVNAVSRISAVRLADGQRLVLSSPPGDSNGDSLPIALGRKIVFQRQFGWGDEGWIARDLASGRERVLWRRRGVTGSAAAALPDGTLAVAWTCAGTSGLDFVTAVARLGSQPIALGPVTAISRAGERLLVETDHGESALTRAGSAEPIVTVHGRIAGAVLLPDGGVRFPVTSAGISRVWQRDGGGALRPWGSFVAVRIVGLAPSPDTRSTAALVTGAAGREIVVFDAAGRPIYRWNPHARSLNPAAWSGGGRRLIAPVLDGAGWRLFALDPFGKASPRDLGLSGFAVLVDRGTALYAVRAGETTGVRELWRLDGRARRLPIDLTLFDIVNWRPVDGGVWLPDRADRDRPRLILRDAASGAVLRSVAAPGLAGAASGLAADARGPVYVRTARDAPDYDLLSLARAGR